MIQAIGYFIIGYVGLELKAPYVSVIVCGFFSYLALLLQSLDLVLTKRERVAFAVLILYGLNCASILLYAKCKDAPTDSPHDHGQVVRTGVDGISALWPMRVDLLTVAPTGTVYTYDSLSRVVTQWPFDSAEKKWRLKSADWTGLCALEDRLLLTRRDGAITTLWEASTQEAAAQI